MKNKSKNIKEDLRSGRLTVGSWITIGNTSLAEIMARSGFDWLTVDMEHSSITLSQAQQLIQVIDSRGVTPLVRVGANDSNLIKRVMDAGSHGVIVPMVNTKEDAIRAVEAVKYPPDGTRGVGLARAQGYGLEFDKYKDWVNKESIVVAQIEHIDAVSNLEEILNVKGVDASIIGPYDLSASLGFPGEFDRRQVKEAINAYLNVCVKLNKPAGFHCIPPSARAAEDKMKEGFKFIAFSLDTLFLGEKIKSELTGLKEKA